MENKNIDQKSLLPGSLMASACILFYSLTLLISLNACNTLNKASVHGFKSGYYEMQANQKHRKVYVEISEEKLEVYPIQNNNISKAPEITVNMENPEKTKPGPFLFRKQGLDIDLTTILMKYRPSTGGLPPQLTTDLNMAVYTGWRRDKFRLNVKENPLGKTFPVIGHFGYDFGLFAGPGASQVTPSTTAGKTSLEYSSLILQAGMAAFLETDLASFGIALGYDYLVGPDRKIWIYRNKPWLGLVVGIALN